MAGTSDYLQNKLIDFELRGQAFTPTPTIYIGIMTCTNGARASSTALALNATISMVAADGFNHLYKATVAGNTAVTAPLFPGVPGETITDGTCTLVEQSASIQNGTAVVEPTGIGSYQRASVSTSMATFNNTQASGTAVASSGTSSTTSNTNTISFVAATAAWTSGTTQAWGFAIFDALSGGNLLRYGGLNANQVINSGNTLTFAPGTLVIKIDNA
jgi:hypothetical protein